MNPSMPRVAVAPRTSGMAITSLVLGCASFMCWMFTGLPAVILGIVALRQIKRSNGQLQGDGLAIGGIVTGAVSSFLILPIMIALLLPAVQAAREAARRSQTTNNMKQISIALQNFADTHGGTLPAAKGDGGSQLSWRVHILPYIEEEALYEQFHLDEPWDSPHNRPLIAKMPAVFQSPSAHFPQGETSFLAIMGPGTAFGDGVVGPKLRDFVDGTSNTVLFVEADRAVPWTKPEDLQFDSNKPMANLGSLHPGGFLAAFGDLSVRTINESMPPELINAMMTIDGDDRINFR